MLIYSFITDYQAFNLRYKDNTTRDKNETKVDKQSANLGKNNEPIQNRLSFLIDCKSVILHHLAILSFPMVRPAWDNWWLLVEPRELSLSRLLISNYHGMSSLTNTWSWFPPELSISTKKNSKTLLASKHSSASKAMFLPTLCILFPL